MSSNSTVSSSPSTLAATSSDGTSLSSPQSPSPPSPTDDPSTPSSVTTSSAQPTTSSVQTTSANPTTSAPQTTAAQSSSPAQTAQTSQSSQVVVASSSNPSSSAASSSGAVSSATPQASSTTSSFTSQVATTLATTDSSGSVVYLTTTVPEVISTTVSSPSSGGNSSSNTGVIVGAVVGGVAGIALIALLLFCIRKRVRKDEFDGNFDPDRVVGRTSNGGGTLPRVDLAEDVTPFTQPYPDQGNASMREFKGAPYIPVPSSFAASGPFDTEAYIPTAATAGGSSAVVQAGPYAPQVNMYGAGPVDWHNPRPDVSPPASTASYNTASTRPTKEREAMGRNGQGQGLGLATQPESPEGGGDVVVHQDAGRAPISETMPPREIPPAYESIPQD